MQQLASIRLRMEAMVRQAQDAICKAVEELDGQAFGADVWQHTTGGGGISRVMQNGKVFEKAGVNVAMVYGTLAAEAARATLGQGRALGDHEVNFYATGVSVVIHPHNPMAPSAHANYRYVEYVPHHGPAPVSWWFGGGADLTPAYLFEADAVHFHRVHKEVCDQHCVSFYPRFKQWCDEYFYIAHRGECRGVGGIFFDNLNDRRPEALLAFVTQCAQAFVPAYLPLVARRKDMPYSDRHKQWQQLRRGRYVEFNLTYDRGTLFGLKTGGRIESILMSLPLLARWEYDFQPPPGSAEARTLEVLRNPRAWLPTSMEVRRAGNTARAPQARP
jgi:coproporphyrinogen III oxidase